MRPTAAFVALLLLLLALAPLATGSHTMGHRYLVYGRLLDANGFPVQNQDVQIRLVMRGEVLSSISTQTDCLGDFESWKGVRGPIQGNPPHGGGEIESVPQQSDTPAYVNFHFHDQFLSNRHQFQIFAGGENWTEGFSSKNRQTASFHQLDRTFAPACGNYDRFNQTLTVRVYVSSTQEHQTAEVPVTPRNVRVEYQGMNRTGETDFMSAFTATLDNVTAAAGQPVTIRGDDVGVRTLRLDENMVKFRRADSITVVGESVTGVLDDLKNFGILLLIVALVVAFYWGGRRLKARMEENRLRQTSTRRRFRREQQP